MWIDLLMSKDEAFECFKRVKALAETESGGRLKAFRSDRGGEFNSIEFKEYCDERGVKHFTTTPYTPQQNGVVEHRNRTVVEMARCLLTSKNVPGEFWVEAVTTTVYLLNRAPTKSLQGTTPCEAWYNKKPRVHHLRTFGCVVHVKQVGPGISKLSDRSTQMVFIGYEKGTKGYRVYDPLAKKLHISRDVIFEEARAWDWKEKARHDPVASVFDVDFYTVARPGTVIGNEAAQPADQDQGSLAQGQWSVNTGSDAGSNLATPPGSPPAQAVEYATPPTRDAVNSEGVPMKFRTLSNIYDITDEVQNFEYSGLCFLAAEEPRSVDEALSEKCWREAMDAEMNSI